MLQCISTIGQHKILRIDTSIHRFKEFFERLFNTHELQSLHLTSSTYTLFSNGESQDISDYESA